MTKIITHTNYASRHDALNPALKLLVGFDLFDVIACTIIETFTNLVGNGRLRQNVAIQARGRQGHFLLHGLPEVEQARTTPLHPSGELVPQLGVLVSYKVNIISKATDHLITQREKTLLQPRFHISHLAVERGIIVLFDVLTQHTRQLTRIERFQSIKLNGPFPMTQLEALPS